MRLKCFVLALLVLLELQTFERRNFLTKIVSLSVGVHTYVRWLLSMDLGTDLLVFKPVVVSLRPEKNMMLGRLIKIE